MLLRNISPLGDLEVAYHGLIEAGKTFIPRREHVAGLIGQEQNFECADDEAVAARVAHHAEANPPAEPDEPQPVEPSTPGEPAAEPAKPEGESV